MRISNSSFIVFLFIIIGPTRLSTISTSFSGFCRMSTAGIFELSTLKFAGASKAKIGLNTLWASANSAVFLMVTILGISWFFATNFLKPSRIITSASFSHF
jgi:hypothetical protein